MLKQAIARVVTPGDEYSEPIDMVDEPDDEPAAVDGHSGGAAQRADPAGHAGHRRRDAGNETDETEPTSGPSHRADHVERTSVELGNDLNWQHKAAILAAY